MRNTKSTKQGSVLVLVVVSLIILPALGMGLLSVAYGTRLRAIQLKTEAVAMLAAEAGYEKAVFWMGKQKDMLSALQQGVDGTNDTIEFDTGYCNYKIELYTFVGSRPVYKIVSRGHSGKFDRTVDVYLVQAISGWDMGKCKILFGGTKTYPVHFASGEIVDLSLHINDLHDNPDYKDIYIDGFPQFLQPVAMGESRHTDKGSDKYDQVVSLFESGIYFDQPDCRITDEQTIQSKMDRFRKSSDPRFTFKPVAEAHAGPTPHCHPAVQLEFFVEGGVGKVRVTNNCTVLGYQRNQDGKTLDFKIKPGTGGEESERYDIYAYHFVSENAEAKGDRFTCRIDETYVTQSFGGVESEPGGQIFVDGNVIIGGDKALHNSDQVVKGRITVVATGNIWVADSVVVDGPHDADGKPTTDNPNVLGLMTKGVLKVVDPGMSGYKKGGTDQYPGPPKEIKDFVYVPIGREDAGAKEDYERHLPDPMVVEGALTVGGGGWGAENVLWYYNGKWYGGRKPADGLTDHLVVRGTITEVVRGVVGLIGQNGYVKHYYSDGRLLEGILPGDMWLRGKYVPTPAGWHDYRANN